ncbi:hypothetical protein QAD02_014098 [Eretmocerus hayati]|uniref:Uncharacterized protein n=1 Tax=Eretmocerus hayati TaxID=131215 RepID=A0ACC2P626_9HYME|nr:hypothetical protein QAD02_014098 [Eretmocerus hayati]
MSTSVEKSLENLRARMKKHRGKVRAKLKSSKKFDTERSKTVPMDTKEESNEVASVINVLDQDQHLIDNRLRAGDEHSSYSNSDSDLSNYDDGNDDTDITHNEGESEPFDQNVFKQRLRIWVSKDITRSKVDELLVIL